MRNRAFTVVELLVVIAIIGVMVALLLPAVQAARESARRAGCTNNLRQIGLAVRSFETAFQKLPANRYGDYDDSVTYGGAYENSRSWSWLSAILPYMDQKATYDAGNIPHTQLNQSAAVATSIRLFHCPSDTLATIRSYPETTHYLRSGMKVGLTNYMGVQGANFCWGDWANAGTNGNDCEGWWHGDGVFYPMDWQKKRDSSRITDGLSNTFMAGEDIWNQTRATCDTPCYGLGFAWAHPVEACAFGNFPPNARRPDGTPYADDDWQGQNGFHSRHPLGVLFVRCDGSVKWVSNSIALGVLRAQCTIAGKEVMLLPD